MLDDEIRLVEPDESMREAYVEHMKDYEAAGKEYKKEDQCREILADFAGYVKRLRNYARGIGLPAGWVPWSEYWLVRGRRILATCGLCHRLTDALRDFGGHVGYATRPSERGKGYATLMLKLLLEKARQMGLDRVLITCGRKNVASARVIRKNGGVLDSESYSTQAGRITQRYWIELRDVPRPREGGDAHESH